MNNVVVTGSFDDLKSRHVRFLEEASKLGNVQVLLWADEAVRALTGKLPKFPVEERSYMLQAIRYVSAVTAITNPIDPDAIPTVVEFSAERSGQSMKPVLHHRNRPTAPRTASLIAS